MRQLFSISISSACSKLRKHRLYLQSRVCQRRSKELYSKPRDGAQRQLQAQLCQAFGMSLIHSIEEIETRQSTTIVFNLCVSNTRKSPKRMMHFVVPMIIFGNEETEKALTKKIAKGKALEEAIFNVITDFAVPMKAILIKVMTNFFGQKCSIPHDIVRQHFCSLNPFAVIWDIR